LGAHFTAENAETAEALILKDYLLDTFVEQDRFKMIQQYCSASQMV